VLGSPSKVAVRAVREKGSLLVSVSDDGVGGAVVRRGSGLAGLRDRVAAHGGSFEVVSPSGRGTGPPSSFSRSTWIAASRSDGDPHRRVLAL
jgi:signal transduction histidine kinase